MSFKTVASTSKTIVDVTDAYLVSLDHEALIISCDKDGNAITGEVGSTGKANATITVYKGTTKLTAVASAPILNQFCYTLGASPTNCTAGRTDNDTLYINTINSNDSGSVTITLLIEGDVTIVKTLTYSKAKVGLPGTTYDLSITGGVRAVTYDFSGVTSNPTSSTPFVAVLTANGVVVTPSSYVWTVRGLLGAGTSGTASYTPTITKPYVSGTDTYVSLTVTHLTIPTTLTIPISISSDAAGVQWVTDWSTSKVLVKGDYLISPKIFAGINEGTSVAPNITGVAMGRDVLGVSGSSANVGVVGYYKNAKNFKLNVDGSASFGRTVADGGIADRALIINSDGSIIVPKITANEIGANVITSSHIAAGSITADRLMIGLGEQGGYFSNPRFKNWSSPYPDGGVVWGAGGLYKVLVDNVNVLQFACPILTSQYGMSLNSSFFANGINLDGLRYFCLEMRFRLTVGTSANGAGLYVDIYRQDASYERIQLDCNTAGSTLIVNTWYTIRKVFALSSVNVSKTFKSISGYLLANYADGSGGNAIKTIQFGSINMYQATEQDFLGQVWTYPNTTSINGGSIQANTITASQIAANTITASQLVATIGTDLNISANTSITSRVTQAQVDTSIKAIQIGGRNLLLNSNSVLLGGSDYPTSSTRVNGKITIVVNTAFNAYTFCNGMLSIPVSELCKIVGTRYCATFEVRTTNLITSGIMCSMDFRTSNISNTITEVTGDILPNMNGVWQKVTCVFRTTVTTNSESLLAISSIQGSGYNGVIIEYRNIKIEQGTKYTNWTPAPEDVQSGIDTAQGVASNALSRVISAETSISQSLSEISLKVNTSDFNILSGAVNANTTSIGLIDGKINFAVSTVTSSTDAANASISEIKSYMDFSTGGLVLGKSGGVNDNLKVKITNEAMSFLDNGVAVAYISNQQMEINKAKILSSIIVGNHVIEKYDSNITLIRWVG